MRVCVFGAAPLDAEWLGTVVAGTGTSIQLESLTATSASAALRAAASRFPGDHLLLLRAGTLRMLTFLGADRVDASAVKTVPVRRAITSLNPKRRSPRR